MTADPEARLAAAKILTMLQDLGGKARTGSGWSSEKEKLRQDAHRWFFSEYERADFEAWCVMAGYDPDYVRDKARRIERDGLTQWRAAAGQGERYAERKAWRERAKLNRMLEAT